MTSLYYRQFRHNVSYVICTSVNREPRNEAKDCTVYPDILTKHKSTKYFFMFSLLKCALSYQRGAINDMHCTINTDKVLPYSRSLSIFPSPYMARFSTS